MSSSASSRPMAARRPRLCSQGLEVVPRRRVEYKGRWLEEMDLDAILARRRNWFSSTSSRIPTLRAAGIPSATWMSRSCSVPASTSTPRSTSSMSRASTTWWRRSPASASARPCRIRSSTTPTRSRSSISRRKTSSSGLKEGKVYVPQQAERAIRHYFQPGNLTALRELALRRTAQRVDEQMVTYMRAHAIAGRGRRASACWSASTSIRTASPSCVTPAVSPTVCARPGRRSTSRPRARRGSSEAERDRIAEGLRWRSGSAARRSPSPRRMSPEASSNMRRPTTSRISSLRSPSARAGWSCCTAR